MTDPFAEKERLVKAVAHLMVILESLGYKHAVTLTNKGGEVTWFKGRKRDRVKKEAQSGSRT